MKRRNLLRICILSIFTFTFGWLIKKESSNTILQQGNSGEVTGENGELSTGKIKFLTKQLTETEKKLKDTVSILAYEHLKVTVTEGYDWHPAFKKAFSEYTRVVVPDGDFYTSMTIEVPRDQSLVMTTKTRVIALSDINIVSITRGAELVNGQLLLKAGATKACLYFDGMKKNVDFSVTGTILRGVGYTGIGIHFDCTNPIGDINTSFSMMGAFHNVKIKSVDTGILMNSGGTTGWSNGHTFNSLQIFGARVFIDIGVECDSNTFNNTQLQWATVTEKFLNIDGSYNKFINTTYWDAPLNQLMFVLGENSLLNRVDYSHAPATAGRRVSQVAIDKGTQNFINDPYINEEVGISGNPISYITDYGESKYKINRFFGDQDDILYNASRFYTVTSSSGVVNAKGAFISSSLNDSQFAQYKFTGNEEAFIEVDLGTSTSLNGFGVVFYGNNIASDFKVTSEDSLGNVTNLYEVTNNRNANIYVPRFQGETIKKIRLTLKKALTIQGVKEDNLVRVKRFYAKGTALGNAYLPTNGGKIDGQIEFLYGSDANQGVVLKSPNGSKYLLEVDNSGVLTTKKI
ncbi:hypothetical protein [Peribacillus asahii]|uniref:hypothetical protein n=1 Tax=Peribacillus asahii TaxID=228899 RepID=UPI002079988B|nr:hypothetical protein [Peribacillus asahii]USK84907.1 hypothetical protein LIT35_21420 [Peribacillus asahii]